MTDVRQIVHELLAQLGSSREAQQYLKEFSGTNQARFAVVKVGGGILRDHLEELTSALAFLHRLGLIPVVLHGAGPQLDQALADAGIETERREGLRVTSEPVMSVARPLMYKENLRLVDALENRGVRARSIQHGVFQCSYLDQDNLGLVGEVEKVELSAVESAVRNGAIPVLTCLGESPSGQVLNINADIATRELVWKLRPHKVIFLSPTGGLLDRQDRIITAVSLTNDYEALMQQPWVHSGMRLKLQQINEMLQRLPDDTSVSITSAAHLTRELFTYRGAGTLVRKGEAINVFEKPDEETLEKVRDLVEHSFNRTLRDDWFDNLDEPLVLLSETGRAAAVMTRGVGGLPYLDKFIVTSAAQGEGLGAAIWQVVRARYPALYWRSRNTNPVTPWYFLQADSSNRSGQWVVFTIGVEPATRRAQCVEDALARDSGWVAQ
ncbi:MAG: acetylglutamate kinase [Xanthomonadales bacterium]|nr:acetylglutamate kinase [Gammaproteobacteria bacterium]NNK04146.1 acetylglutamate kinase [Xanthomonadales bacterium]